MVNKRIIILILSFLIFNGCCYTGRISEFGLPRKEIRELDKPLSYDLIDTLSVYKLEINYFYKKASNEITFIEKDDENKYGYTSYLKFYRNGKLGLFVIPKEDMTNLTKEHFNPQKAKMGYYYINGNEIKTRISTIGDCTLYIANNKGEIIHDSIILKESGFGNIYVRRKVPKEFLEGWIPDW